MTRRTPNQTDKDRHLWQSLTEQVKPLAGRSSLAARPSSPSPYSLEVAPRPYAPPPPKPRANPLPSLAHSKHSPATAGIDANTEKRFRAGKMPIDARLDLHGMTKDAAHRATASLVTRAYHTEKRCLLIITGKGGSYAQDRGILRRALPLWLDAPELRPMILTLAPAKPEHGGDGAVYVLLRRKREPVPKGQYRDKR